MSIRKNGNGLQMPVTRPDRLMDMQDTERKGDGTSPSADAEERVLVGFKIPVSLKRELKLKSARTGRTMADLAAEGIRMVLQTRE